MNDSSKRGRRTNAAPSHFRSPPRSTLEPPVPYHFGAAEVTASVAITVVGLAIAALAWLVAIHAGQEQRNEIREQAEQTLMAQAATMAETVDHELLLIDQSLAIIQATWQRDSVQVDLGALRRTMPVLTQTTDDLFISDNNHVIRQDILPRAIGQEIGANYVASPRGSLEQHSRDGTTHSQSLLP